MTRTISKKDVLKLRKDGVKIIKDESDKSPFLPDKSKVQKTPETEMAEAMRDLTQKLEKAISDNAKTVSMNVATIQQIARMIANPPKVVVEFPDMGNVEIIPKRRSPNTLAEKYVFKRVK